MGGALGGVGAMFMPNEGAGFWPLISMGAILGGTMRSPFTGVIFALELTHDVNVLLPLLVASVIAHGFTVLTLRRSILTEKISRRGYHLSREYATDPLEILFVREVMRTNILALPLNVPLEELAHSMRSDHRRSQRLFPVVDAEGRLTGVVTRSDLRKFMQAHPVHNEVHALAELVRPNPAKAFPDEPLRAVVYRMAETGLTRLLVVERDDPRKLVGIVSLNDLLKARVRNLEEERRRERVLTIRRIFPLGSGRTAPR
jgi:CBS domain-containing protein